MPYRLVQANVAVSRFPKLFVVATYPQVNLPVVVPNIRVLAILDTDKTTSDLDGLIGAVDYYGSKGDSDGVTRKSPVEVGETVLDRGGIPVLAHADNPKGLLRPRSAGSKKLMLDANTVSQILDCDGILAMEVIDPEFQKPDLYEQRKLA